jgi:hypothetical protein
MFTKLNKGTKAFKLFEALYNGETLTPAQISKRFGIKNVTAEVSRVRQGGYAVYAKAEKATNGQRVTRYEMGTPSRNIVAAGYRALALGL